MNPIKQHKKLQQLNVKAEQCLSREEAQELIRKADKAHYKLEFATWYGQRNKRELDKDPESLGNSRTN
tara:strand:- start:13104 stop:13307 length:204 start_codon:yes stop_codon:yes gene_type:complete